MLRILYCVIMSGFFICAGNLSGQNHSKSILNDNKKYLKQDYLNVGILMQVLLDHQNIRSHSGNNGFSVANMRLKIKGRMNNRFGYFFQAKFNSTPGILDAYMYYNITPLFGVQIGQFKSSFSGELLVSVAEIDFVNRSRIVNALAPNRQFGMQFYGTLAKAYGLKYNLGIYNGNGIHSKTNDNNHYMYTGRLSFSPFRKNKKSIFSIDTGINVSSSKDKYAPIGEELNPFVFKPIFFTGNRTLWGGDVRITIQKFLLAGEYIRGDFDGSFRASLSDAPFSTSNTRGYYVTTGYWVTRKLHLLLRFDNFDSQDKRINRDEVVFGLNYRPVRNTRFQLNCIVDTDKTNLKMYRILIIIQLVL